MNGLIRTSLDTHPASVQLPDERVRAKMAIA
jgi:hypothetical protein